MWNENKDFLTTPCSTQTKTVYTVPFLLLDCSSCNSFPLNEILQQKRTEFETANQNKILHTKSMASSRSHLLLCWKQLRDKLNIHFTFWNSNKSSDNSNMVSSNQARCSIDVADSNIFFSPTTQIALSLQDPESASPAVWTEIRRTVTLLAQFYGMMQLTLQLRLISFSRKKPLHGVSK